MTRQDYLNKEIRQEDLKKAPIPLTKGEKLQFFINRISELEGWLARHPTAPALVDDTLLLNRTLLELVRNGKI